MAHKMHDKCIEGCMEKQILLIITQSFQAYSPLFSLPLSLKHLLHWFH